MKKIVTLSKVLIILSVLLLNTSSKSQCSASFTYALGANGNVTFTSTSAPSNSITTTYTWTFGNGIPSYTNTGGAGMYPNYTYTANGVYTVTLLIMNTSPTCTAQVTNTIAISNVTCGLSANFTVTQGSNGLVNFANTSVGTTSLTTYSWAFGNGGASTSISPVFSYTANGTYIVTLTANNNSTLSCISTKTLSILVNSICNLVPAFAYTIGANGNVQLISTTTPTTTLTYTWTFGNSTFSFNANPNITYTANGSYTVSLFVSSSIPACNSSTSSVITITNVSNCSLTANFFSTQGSNGVVNFGNTSTGTVSGTTYTWNFGNGQNSNAANPVANYTVNGNYTISLFASNNSTPNCTSTKTVVLFVNTICNVTAGFTYTAGINGLVNFSNTSFGTNSLTTYVWNFGHSSAGNSFSSTATNPSHLYPNGTYTVLLTASNSTVCTNSASLIISVTTNTCSLQASLTHTQVGSGQVNFSNSSIGTNSNTSINWSFGDGWTSNTNNPTHIYTNGGTHYISLQINDTSNVFCSSSVTQAINITGVSCTANPNFSLTPTATLQYWNAIPVYPYNVTNAQWTWGDGSSSIGLYSSHQYSAAGLYTLCLSVTVSCGASASSCSTYSVFKPSGSSSIIYVNVLNPIKVTEIVGLTSITHDDLGITMYPNPSNGHVWLNLSKHSGILKMQVNNLLGETLLIQQFEANSDDLTTAMDLNHLPIGMYCVHLSNGREMVSIKLLLTKD